MTAATVIEAAAAVKGAVEIVLIALGLVILLKCVLIMAGAYEQRARRSRQRR